MTYKYYNLSSFGSFYSPFHRFNPNTQVIEYFNLRSDVWVAYENHYKNIQEFLSMRGDTTGNLVELTEDDFHKYLVALELEE